MDLTLPNLFIFIPAKMTTPWTSDENTHIMNCVTTNQTDEYTFNTQPGKRDTTSIHWAMVRHRKARAGEHVNTEINKLWRQWRKEHPSVRVRLDAPEMVTHILSKEIVSLNNDLAALLKTSHKMGDNIMNLRHECYELHCEAEKYKKMYEEANTKLIQMKTLLG